MGILSMWHVGAALGVSGVTVGCGGFNVGVHQHPSKGCSKQRFLGSSSRFSESLGQGVGPVSLHFLPVPR